MQFLQALPQGRQGWAAWCEQEAPGGVKLRAFSYFQRLDLEQEVKALL